MQAEVIAIGDELTSGQGLDTNSQWLSQRLGELGIRVLFHTTVGDELEPQVQAIRLAIDRAEVVVCSGGLGPTADDLTRHALAEAAGLELVLDEDALAHIRALFARRRREMPKRNVVQAMFPKGSRPIPNPHGTAPGIDMVIARPDRQSSRVLALPGVPAEMHEMWQQTVEPELQKAMGPDRRVIRHRRINCFGAGESDLEQMLPDLIRRGRRPSVGITVSKATITLRITAEAESEEACHGLMAPTVATIRECLGDLVFGEEDDELQHVVLRLLSRASLKLATVELGSGGLLAHCLGEADPAGKVFVGGEVHQRGHEMVASLRRSIEEGNGEDVSEEDPELAESYRILRMFHEELDAEIIEPMMIAGLLETMVRETRRRFRADYGLAIGPFPRSDSESSVPGEVVFALVSRRGAKTTTAPFAGHPEILKPRAVKQALNFLRLSLLNPDDRDAERIF